MVIYFDTSALLKLYVEEDDRALVEESAVSAQIVTSTVTYAEARAGLARRLREGDFTDPEYREIVSKLDEDWLTFDRLEVSNLVAYHAGRLAEGFALRGYDAIHLASAVHLASRFDDLHFLAFDRRLVGAAEAAGMALFTISE
jgi:predicted nucleic acid-binding protein